MLFSSLFLAGFECTTGYNVHRQWIDQVVATQHDQHVDEDYARLRQVGIRAAREAIRWPLVDSRGRFDFSTVQPFLEASKRHQIQIVFDLFHFGYPADIDLLSAEFPKRFADYCYAAARYVASQTDGPCYFTPINEPSFFAWAAGEVGLFAPHLRGQGCELKICLVRAAIEGINAIWAACPHAQIINVDPVCRMVAPHGRPDLQQQADHFNLSTVFQGWDMMSGRWLPELGGSSTHLGMIGINYYWTNQWQVDRPGMPLRDDDPRRWPLARLVRQVWERYGVDLVITETSHVDEMRPIWLREITDEVEALLDQGVPLRGICLYPILGMPEWHEPHKWTRMGLWDLAPQSPTLGRVIYAPMLEALREAQQRLEPGQLLS